MGRLFLAIRVFFRVLFHARVAGDVQRLLNEEVTTAAPSVEAGKINIDLAETSRAPARSESLTLLSTLQREARLIDFLQEPIDGYSDAQIGAAVREVHRQSAAVLARVFDLQPVVRQQEGTTLQILPEFDAARYRLTGNVVGEPPYSGTLVHHGWEATRCGLPAWSGSATSARVVVPAEVEVR